MVSQRILIAVDGSENSRRAVEVAQQVLGEREGEILVVHAYHVPPEYDALSHQLADGPSFFRRLASEAEERGSTAVEESLKDASPSLRERARILLLQGRPGPTIVDAAKREEATLVVLGSRGRGDVASMLFGSVSHHVLHHAPCPVLVVP